MLRCMLDSADLYYNAIFLYEVDTSSVTGSVHITLL